MRTAGGAAILLRKRAPVASLGLVWVLLSHPPFANSVQPTAVLFTERLLLLPAAGIVLLAGTAVVRISRTRQRAALLAVELVAAGNGRA